MSAGLGAERGRLGHDVGRRAGVNHAHVARAPLAVLLHEPMPAVLHERRDCQRRNRDRRHAFFRRHAGVARYPLDGDVHSVAAGRADRDLLHGTAVEVEGELRPAERGGLHEPGAVETDLLLDGEQERERRMRQLRLQDPDGGRKHHGHARAIVAAEAGLGIGALDHLACDHGLRPEAHRHRVHMSHQEPAGPGHCAWQLHDQIPDVALHGRLGVGHVEGDGRGWTAGIDEPLHDPLRHGLLVARHAGDRQEVENNLSRRPQVGLGGGGGFNRSLLMPGGTAYTGHHGRGT